jgi:hypothetical protein
MATAIMKAAGHGNGNGVANNIPAAWPSIISGGVMRRRIQTSMSYES